MSVIPKVGVSMPSTRSKSKLSFDCSTTANIGDIQPTMCRLMVPNQTNHVKVSSLVRLASMPLPTFGRMHLKHYHAFVPYSQLWEPFTAFLSNQRFSSSNRVFVPVNVPRFPLHAFWANIIRQYSYISVCNQNGEPLSVDFSDESKVDVYLDLVRRVFQGLAEFLVQGPVFGVDRESVGHKFSFDSWSDHSDGHGGFVFGSYKFNGDPLDSTTVVRSSFSPINTEISEASQQAVGSVGLLGADFIEEFKFVHGSFDGQTGYLCYKLMPAAKHLRKIVIGLGSQFSPYNFLDEHENVFKLLAYYKTWFEYFRPLREKSFTDTNCYKLIKLLSESDGGDFWYDGNEEEIMLFRDFVMDLMNDTYYYLPQDYFAMAVTHPMQGNNNTATAISSATPSDGVETTAVHNPSYEVVNMNPGNPLAVKLAMKLLNFTNKNTVIGRSIREYIRVHYGVFEDYAPDSSGITRIGVSDVNVQISDVMSTAPSDDGYLGEYAGKGIGYNDSETFDYTAKEFGVWLTLSVVVPQSGYYQGTLKENFYKDRFDFPAPEFDAIGYQVLERRELMDSYAANSHVFNPNTAYSPREAFGFVPRYSDVKVGRNLVNGDLSIAGMPSMRPYFFDRRFSEMGLVVSEYYKRAEGSLPVPTENKLLTAVKLVKPDYVPTVVFDDFRRIDPSDTLGQYNRIFNVTTNWVDHFIINAIFEVTAMAPWKSLNDSFDTFVEGENQINVVHS